MPSPAGPPPRRQRRKAWLLIAGAVVLAALLGAGAFLGFTRANDSDQGQPTEPTEVTTSATETVTESPPTPPPPPPTPPDEEQAAAVAVVENYFDAINDGDYARAWELGGKNIHGGSYESFVEGFQTTTHDSVTIRDVHGGTVEIELDAQQTDGSHRYFGGQYSVRDGVIVAADIEEQ
ncbi:hypothetical protein [Streptomyces sp. 7N604]|uniref:hypothetical protein n=1 Tax=Streptomyces sp. 7N604 TaxID=3457415 RepID=UPI003FCFF214